jgi:zinc transport system ATP-binding protein
MKPLLQIKNLCFGFSSQDEVLHNISFSIEEGNYIAIIGPNGSGKSTLLKLILGELLPKHGTIEIKPETSISYVPQTHIFDKNFPITVLEVVLGGCLQIKEKLKRAHEALDEVGMLKHEKCSFGELSGGQAQRVLIARALARHPTLLLLDEPTSHIDTSTEISLMNHIRSQKKKMTILMVTHNVQATLDSVDGILSLHGGKVYMQPKDVCEHFALGLYHEPLIEVDMEHFK